MMRSAGSLIPMALAAPLALGGCFERAVPTVQNTDTPVQVVRVMPARDTTTRAYAGIIRPRREADIGFRAGGRIVAREADIGARVSAGQVLARLDPADLALQLRQAEADLASAEAQQTQAVSDAGRSRTLRGQGWVSVQDDELKQAAARSAQEKANTARAALQLARNRLDYAVLRAPRDSVVTGVLADAGTVVSEGQPVLHLAEAGELEAEVALPEQTLGAGIATATVTLWARPDLAIKAHLRERAGAADGKLRTYTSRFALDTQPDYLAIGMTAMVTLKATGSEPGLSLVPIAALADRGLGQAVWLVKPDGSVVARPVAVRALRADAAVVTGLQPGDDVVAMGVQKIDPAARVRVADRRTMAE